MPKGTAAADAWGFGWAVAFGKDTNTRWMTPRLSDPTINVVTERWRTAICLFWMAQHMSPSARRRSRASTRPNPPAHCWPSTAGAACLRDCDRYVSDMVHVKPVLKGLCALVKKQYGLAAFAVHQAKVFSADMLLAIAEPSSQSGVATWSPALTEAWGVMHPYLVAIGERKEEITAAFTATTTSCAANFVWIDDDGNELRMTIEVISSRRNGHLLRRHRRASKCDRLCITWAKQKQILPLRRQRSPQLCRRLPEMGACVPMSARVALPVARFLADGRRTSLLAARRRRHAQAARAAGSRRRESRRTSPSTRTATRSSARCTSPEPQGTHSSPRASCRPTCATRRSTPCMVTARCMPSDFADNVAIITRTDPSTAKRDDLPEYEPLGAVEAVEAAIDELDGLGNNAKPAAAPTARAAPTAAAAAPPPKPAKPRTVTIIGDATPVATREPETWHVVGSRISLPNELWGEDDGGSSACTIAHFLNVYRFPNGGSHVAYAVSIDGYDGLYAVRATAISRYADADTKKRLRKKGMPRPVATAPRHPAGSPPPSPPPSPKGGDTFGTRKKTAANWGTSDKATRERARRNRWAKLRRAFEREAWAASHPQECPVCMEQEMTHLLYRCGLNVEPFHRHHGLCGECAQTILDTTATCPLCNLPVEGALHVGTAAFA